MTPYGTLPPGEHGEFGLIVHPDGRGEEISFPADSAISNREETVIEGDLNPDGVFSGRFTTHQTGDRQYELRGALTSSLNSTERERLARQIANNVIPGANGDSVQLFDGRDWTADPRISVAIHDGRVASKSGAGSDILTLPLRDFAVPGLVNDLTTRGPRKYAINAAAVSGGLHVESSELRLTLPEGWRAQLPPSITATGPFGSYSAEYSQQGRVLRVVRRLTGVKGIEPRAKIGDLIAWLKEMSQDDVKYIVLEHGGATPVRRATPRFILVIQTSASAQ